MLSNQLTNLSNKDCKWKQRKIFQTKNTIENYFTNIGCEVHYFKVGWYNEIVGKPFKLLYDYHTLACVIISTPSMFEKAFVPFIKKHVRDTGSAFEKDPLDECLSQHFRKCVTLLHVEADIIKDYELMPSRRPKILAQSAAHVAGAAYYYQQTDAVVHSKNCSGGAANVTKYTLSDCDCPKPFKDKMFGVCIHPVYGGWFAIRGVVIFTNIIEEELNRLEPHDVVNTQNKRVELLQRFNKHWKDGTYRNIIQPKEKYSELQQKYFNTLPKERYKLLEEIAQS